MVDFLQSEYVMNFVIVVNDFFSRAFAKYFSWILSQL